MKVLVKRNSQSLFCIKELPLENGKFHAYDAVNFFDNVYLFADSEQQNAITFVHNNYALNGMVIAAGAEDITDDAIIPRELDNEEMVEVFMSDVSALKEKFKQVVKGWDLQYRRSGVRYRVNYDKFVQNMEVIGRYNVALIYTAILAFVELEYRDLIDKTITDFLVTDVFDPFEEVVE